MLASRFYYGFIIFLLFSGTLQAETYVREYMYKASRIDNEETSRVIALDQIKLLLLNEIGTYIRQNMNITKDASGNIRTEENVKVITANFTKINIIKESWDGNIYYIKAALEVDASRVHNAVNEYRKSKSEENHRHLEALKANERLLQKSRDEISRLRDQLRFTQTDSNNEALVKKYNDEINKLTMGEIFANGFYHEQNGSYDKAIYWYNKAAQRNNSLAQVLLGVLYRNGQGVEKDPTKSIEWFRKAAKQNEAAAQYYIGIMLFAGEGVEQDYTEAANWLRKAAEQGDAISQYSLGGMYL